MQAWPYFTPLHGVLLENCILITDSYKMKNSKEKEKENTNSWPKVLTFAIPW